MKRLIISAFLVIAMLAGAAAGILPSRTLLSEATAQMPTIPPPGL